MTTVITSGKTVEDAVNQGLAELGVSRDKVEIQVLEQPSKGFLGLFGVKAAKVEVKLLPVPEAASEQPIKPATPEPEIDALLEGVAVHNPYEEAAAFLKEVAAGMGLDVEVHIKKQRDGHIFNISGEDLGMIIGRRGQTLDALQYLTNIVANRYSENFVRIVLDAENFRQRRRKTLEDLAERLAGQAIRTGKEVVLEPMPPLERKVIHAKLQNHPQIKTLSKGEEPNRRVVITLK
ncbi:RNA-binding cell elongation regulator Jag/EloR [Paenibacillus silvae]|uniref:RNA-binding protein KhpB n=1 Tax=Paenibacillus silvae TaxID=1325358 RepID=A0ABQ1ZGV4_9BACL|nr:RNA-binding cell elongation regulator Jag/EloR [Paenibacillus silvae]MCK6076598.1 protein jag [Paenibacillus silvae]MCK6151025.1 protein jag [Paenibacillus silvae]MCK6269285.1 protein jag [Paenibacillus silvae]GGH66018.1 DNA-binding protein [Paenibacillus silvae]